MNKKIIKSHLVSSKNRHRLHLLIEQMTRAGYSVDYVTHPYIVNIKKRAALNQDGDMYKASIELLREAYEACTAQTIFLNKRSACLLSTVVELDVIEELDRSVTDISDDDRWLPVELVSLCSDIIARKQMSRQRKHEFLKSIKSDLDALIERMEIDAMKLEKYTPHLSAMERLNDVELIRVDLAEL